MKKENEDTTCKQGRTSGEEYSNIFQRRPVIRAKRNLITIVDCR